MRRKSKEILFPVFVVISTAIFFFFLGYTVSFLHGPEQVVKTKIQYVEVTSPQVSETTATASKEDKIDLNTATKDQLMTVPGIGNTYAQRILDYRDQFGPFVNLEQLKEIEGVGDKRYEQWIQYFMIS